MGFKVYYSIEYNLLMGLQLDATDPRADCFEPKHSGGLWPAGCHTLLVDFNGLLRPSVRRTCPFTAYPSLF